MDDSEHRSRSYGTAWPLPGQLINDGVPPAPAPMAGRGVIRTSHLWRRRGVPGERTAARRLPPMDSYRKLSKLGEGAHGLVYSAEVLPSNAQYGKMPGIVACVCAHASVCADVC